MVKASTATPPQEVLMPSVIDARLLKARESTKRQRGDRTAAPRARNARERRSHEEGSIRTCGSRHRDLEVAVWSTNHVKGEDSKLC